MMLARSFSSKLALTASLASVIAWGCSGSGPSTPSGGAGSPQNSFTGRGNVTVSVTFPPRTARAAGASSAAAGTSGVPIGARSVLIAITEPNPSVDSGISPGTDLAQPQIVAAPSPLLKTRPGIINRAEVGRQSTPPVTFSNIRAGSAHLHVTAYNSLDATGPPVGAADTVVVGGLGPAAMKDFPVPAAGSVSVTPVVTSTAATIQVTQLAQNGTVLTVPLSVTPGSTITVNNSDVLTFVAKLYDAESPTAAELGGSPLVWSSSNSLVATVQVQDETDPSTALDPSTATVTVNSENIGTATIEVRDPNSGFTFDFNVQVQPPPSA